MTPSPILHTALEWAPVLPWNWLIGLAIGSVLIVLLGLWRRARGGFWRLLPLALILLALANPQVVTERQRPLADIAQILVDDSPSQQLGDRPAQTKAALSALMAQLDKQPNLEVRQRRLSQFDSGPQQGQGGSRLFTALRQALADIPPQRLAASIVITDGQVHDLPPQVSPALTQGAPLHVLLTGKPNETDRRLIIDQAPAFALVGSSVPVTLRAIDDALPPGSPIPVTLSRADGNQEITLPNRQARTLTLPVTHAGASVFSFAAAPRPDEPSLRNNSAAVTLNGIRDRLRVLLISGRPHIGERAWRQLLKADPNVDLIHFTILRSPLKADAAPLNELALIAFPMRELFEEKLDGFDLIIFDSYSRQGPVLATYFDNIARYVRNGGALMVAAGPDFGGPGSLTNSPLAAILPVAPDGAPRLGRYIPHLTADGQRHPITESLAPQANLATPPWGPWLRQLPVTVTTPEAHTLMRGSEDRPLLVVNRVEKGRVAVLLSDSLWLWARGWQGGGPQAELVRRLAHWLMGEPDLEEEALSAQSSGAKITLERRSLSPHPTPPEATITAPDGSQQALSLAPTAPGQWKVTLDAPTPGLWHVQDGSLQAATAVTDPDPLESAQVVATAAPLLPLTKASSGTLTWLSQSALPPLRRSPHPDPSRLTLLSHQTAITLGYHQSAAFPPWLLALATLATLIIVWRQEGR